MTRNLEETEVDVLRKPSCTRAWLHWHIAQYLLYSLYIQINCWRWQPTVRMPQSLTLADLMPRSRGSAQTYNYADIEIECTHGQPGTCTQRVQLESKFQHTGTWSVAAWLPRCLCYHPALLFHHLRLITLPLPKGKIRGAFRCVISNSEILINCVRLNLHNSKLRVLKSVCTLR
jgi:hypothetical protein